MQQVTHKSTAPAQVQSERRLPSRRLLGQIFGFGALLMLPLAATAEAIPALNVLEVSDDGTEYSLSLQLLLLMTVLALLPSVSSCCRCCDRPWERRKRRQIRC